jgi:L-fucose isomerase-like protein
MGKQVFLFWPGDGRKAPNDLAKASMENATHQLELALRKLGREPRLIEGFVSKPHESIEKLGPISDPMIGVCVHWCYAPHTTEGVVGKQNPLLLASNFSGQWPGLVGLLNTGASLESLDRPFSRIWTDSKEWTSDDVFMDRLAQWCETGKITYSEKDLSYEAPVSSEASETAHKTAEQIRKRRILILMLGDTSMGMINGYFGARLLHRYGFAEHKIDQAWIIDRGSRVDSKRIRDAFQFVQDRGVKFHWRENGAADFNENATCEQLRDYLTVLDLVKEYKADCLGWQYQLGLIPLRPPSDFSEGLFNSTCRPESNGDTVVCSTEADQGNVIPMEMMKRLLKSKGLHQGVFFHDVRWGGEWGERFIWVLLNSGSSGAYAFNHKPEVLSGVHSYRQPAAYFPTAGGTFTGESLPGKVTWARSYIRGGVLWMDIGKGEVVKLPAHIRDEWWSGTTREWPLMTADLGMPRDTLMAHYMSNHIAVAYGDIFSEMLALSKELGFEVRIISHAN